MPLVQTLYEHGHFQIGWPAVGAASWRHVRGYPDLVDLGSADALVPTLWCGRKLARLRASVFLSSPGVDLLDPRTCQGGSQTRRVAGPCAVPASCHPGVPSPAQRWRTGTAFEEPSGQGQAKQASGDSTPAPADEAAREANPAMQVTQAGQGEKPASPASAEKTAQTDRDAEGEAKDSDEAMDGTKVANLEAKAVGEAKKNHEAKVKRKSHEEKKRNFESGCMNYCYCAAPGAKIMCNEGDEAEENPSTAGVLGPLVETVVNGCREKCATCGTNAGGFAKIECNLEGLEASGLTEGSAEGPAEGIAEATQTPAQEGNESETAAAVQGGGESQNAEAE